MNATRMSQRIIANRESLLTGQYVLKIKNVQNVPFPNSGT